MSTPCCGRRPTRFQGLTELYLGPIGPVKPRERQPTVTSIARHGGFILQCAPITPASFRVRFNCRDAHPKILPQKSPRATGGGRGFGGPSSLKQFHPLLFWHPGGILPPSHRNSTRNWPGFVGN
jgi:hypothetical protein